MATQNMRVEVGSWVEGDTPKRDGKGMRKVWVSGEMSTPRLSVIAGERDTHVITLHVGTPEQRTAAREALTLALAGLDALEAPKASKPASKPAQAPKAPAPVTRNPAPASLGLSRAEVKANAADTRQAIIDNARAERAALSVGTVKAPAKAPAKPVEVELDWFATLMHEAGAV